MLDLLSEPLVLLCIAATWPIWPMFSARIGRQKGEPIAAFLAGALFGPLGLLAAALSGAKRHS